MGKIVTIVPTNLKNRILRC